MDTKSKNNHKLGILLIILTILLPAVVTVALYPVFDSRADLKVRLQEDNIAEEQDAYVSSELINEIYLANFVLYYDLQKKADPELNTPADVFAPKLTQFYGESTVEYNTIRAQISDEMDRWRQQFVNLMDNRDYYAVDEKTGMSETNTVNNLKGLLNADKAARKELQEVYSNYFIVQFDELGDIKLLDTYQMEADQVYRELQELRHSNPYTNYYGDEYEFDGFNFEGPKNMTVVYASKSSPITIMNDYESNFYYRYYDSGITTCFLLCVLFVALVAFFLPRKSSLGIGNEKIFRAPLELGILVFILASSLHVSMIHLLSDTLGGIIQQELAVSMPEWAAEILVYGYNFLAWAVMYALFYWMATVLRPVFTDGPIRYIKKRSLIYRIFPYLKRQIKRFHAFITDVDLTENMNKSIWKIVIANFVVVSVICFMWVFGIFGVIIYSVILFIVLRKYFSKLREQYETLLKATNEIAEGNLDVTIEEDLGLFNPFKGEIQKIQSGFKKAVDEEVKSQNMKTELITNVSHDLKTPLTAIITYVDLLKDETITEEERRSYIATLEKKSQRLKVLIEDLFEVSKANTKNVTLDIMDVDVVNLMKQVRLELDDKIQDSSLDFRWNLPEEKVILPLDSQKTYRVFENLLNNILKYAMPNTRVYVDVKQAGEHVQVTMKNISATELNFNPDEITERFVRGDLSRNTEGSGLGLAIAKSFVELQNGSLQIDIDGDLFKVMITW